MISSGGISDLNTIGLDAYAFVVGTGTPAITKSSSNVTSVTDNGTGAYTVNFNALPSANYTVVATGEETPATNVIARITSRSTTSVSLGLGYGTSTVYDTVFNVIIAGA